MNLNATSLPKQFFALFILTFALAFQAVGQSVWMPEPGNKKVIGLEVMIPSFDDRLGIEAPSSAVYLYTHLPVSGNLALQFDLPVSHFSAGNSETAVGNPYLGVQTGLNSDLKFDLGVRLPLSKSDNVGLLTGTLSENYQTGPFVSEAFSIIPNVHYRHVNSNTGLGLRLDGGPEIIFPTGGGGELFLKYGGQLLLKRNQLTFRTGIVGRLIATEENLSFSERSINSLGLATAYNFDQASIGGYLEVPLNNDLSIFSLANDWLHTVIGLNFSLKI